MINFNCLILGDKAAGKSTFIKRHATGQFDESYIPTNKEVKSILTFQTNRGQITFNVYEGGHPSNIDCAIVMFDLSKEQSLDDIITYYNSIMTKFGDIPVVICGNKSDMKIAKMNAFLLGIHKTFECLYFDVSAKSNYNYEKPFLFLIRKLLTGGTQTYNNLKESGVNFIEVH